MLALFIDKNKLSLEQKPLPAEKFSCAIIKVNLAGICSTDIQLLHGYKNFCGIPGHEFVGKVVSSETLSGKRVVGEINISCNDCDLCNRGIPTHCRKRLVMGIWNYDGAHAEYVTLPQQNLHVVPDDISDEVAVLIEPLAAACRILQQVKITKDHCVAIVGDGKLSFFIAHVLSSLGCTLIMLGKYPHKLQLCQSVCTEVMTEAKKSLIGAVDFVVECTGHPSGLNSALNLLKPRGTLILKSTYAQNTNIPFSQIAVNEINIVGSRCGNFSDALEILKTSAHDFSPIIQSVMPLKHGIKAYETAMQKGATKVLLDCS